jgi:ubiquitin C-terminal hydrolase
MTTIDADYFKDKKIDSDKPPYIPINNCRKAESVPYNNFIGLKNNGNTCFFNSALQLLNSMELFRNYFLKLEIDDCNVFTLALKTVFTLMNFNDNNPIDLDKININHNGIINKSLLVNLILEAK